MTQTDRYRVSACLLAYNHADLIEESVRSVLDQDEKDFELIVSDDCSRDNTWEVLQRIAASDARVRVIRTPKNLGMAGNANFAASHAKGKYIALLHHDDFYLPTLLRRWADVADRHPNVAFVSNAYGFHGSSRIDIHPFAEVTPGHVALEKHFFRTWGFPVRGTALIRREAWERVGGMRLQFGLLADVDLWLRLAREADFGYVAEPLIVVREQKPDDYPSEYTNFSWRRIRTQYDIFGTNCLEYYGNTLRGRLEYARYRTSVSLNETYWLAYGVAKRRRDVLATSDEVSNRYEHRPVKALRKLLRGAAQWIPSNRAQS